MSAAGLPRRVAAVVAALAVLVAACQSAPVQPSTVPALSTGRGPLDACDPAGHVPCLTADAVVSVPVPGTASP